jgi:hypothetical protein
MLKGDISNELPQRIIVVADVFLNVERIVKKKFKVFPVVKVNKSTRREILSYLFLLTNKRGVTLELVSFDLSEEELNEVMLVLDKMGTNPFRYCTTYDRFEQLVAELPYRPEVIGVLDIPTRLLRYGHWGLDFTAL